MKYKSFDNMNCSIAQSLGIIGERWSLLIIRDAFRGLRRFSQFQKSLGIARNILTTRLNRLVEEGILEKKPMGDGSQHEYVLTQSGLDLYPVLLAIIQWGDKYKPATHGIRLYNVDKKTKRPIRPLVPIDEDGTPLSLADLEVVIGPGLLNQQS